MIALTKPFLDNLSLRILLSAKELSKGCICYNLGVANFIANDLLSTGVNFYYSLYHSCVSTISSTSNAILIEKCVDEWKNRTHLPSLYVPLSHSETTKLINKLDVDLGKELNNLKNIREYLSYGPNVLYELDKKDGLSKVLIYTCKFQNLRHEIKDFKARCPSLILRCSELIKMKLSKSNFFFLILEFYQITKIICDDMGLKQEFVNKCWNMMEPFDERSKIKKIALHS